MSSPRRNQLGRMAYLFAWPGLYVYLRIGARTRVLICSGGKVLLVKSWLDDGRWGLPGGGLHRAEEPLYGAIREVREETGVALAPDTCVSLGSEWGKRQGLKFFCHFFSVEIAEPVLPVRQRSEIVDAQWFARSELATIPLKQEVAQAFELLGDG